VTDGASLVTGHTVHAALDRQGRPCRLPVRVRALLADGSSEIEV
jgi:acyl-CoA thioesterase FadM